MEEVGDKEIQILNELFAKATEDPEFRNALLKDPSSILDEYGLSDETKKMMIEGLLNML